MVVYLHTPVQRLGSGCVYNQIHLAAPVGGQADSVGAILFNEIYDRQSSTLGQIHIIFLRT